MPNFINFRLLIIPMQAQMSLFNQVLISAIAIIIQ